MTDIKQDKSLRKVAILVASLDENWGERILSGLAPQTAVLVRQQIEALTSIDPDEQEQIVAEFRRSLNPANDSSEAGVEIEASLLQRIDHDDYSFDLPAQPRKLDTISTDDAESLSEILSGESLQTVAVVLSRLETDRAAAVLSKLSLEQQTEILNRLEQLGDTDEHAVAVIEAQINQWIASQRQRRERMAAGKQMVERLINRASANKADKVLQGKLPKSAMVTGFHIDSQHKTRNAAVSTPVRYERLPPPAAKHEAVAKNQFVHLTPSECLSQLERLPDDKLFAALSRAESHVALLALIGTSKQLMNRVTRRMSRRGAREVRQQVRDIGPTRLSDILSAQQEILQLASEN